MTKREERKHKFIFLFTLLFYPDEEIEDRFNHYFSFSDYEEEGQLIKLYDLEESDKERIGLTVREIHKHIYEIDERINAVAFGWNTKRMAGTDLTLLRLAVYEILYEENIPESVTINEVVELAKTYGGEESGAFVNGVLGRFLRDEKKSEDVGITAKAERRDEGKRHIVLHSKRIEKKKVKNKRGGKGRHGG